MLGTPQQRTDLNGLISLAHASMQHTKYALPVTLPAQFADPYVALLMEVFSQAFPTLPEAVRMSALSMDFRVILRESKCACGFSRLGRDHAAALTAAPTSQSVPSLPMAISALELMKDPRLIPSLRADAALLPTYAFGHVAKIAASWLVVTDGAPLYVWNVLKALYPALSVAQITMIVEQNTVEGVFAFSGILTLALLSEWHFSFVRDRFRFFFGDFFTEMIKNANTKAQPALENLTNRVMLVVMPDNPTLLETRVWSLVKWIANLHSTVNYHGLIDMARFMLQKQEVCDIMVLGPHANAEFNTALQDFLSAHAAMLRLHLQEDYGALLACMQFDTTGAYGLPGVNLDRPTVGPAGVFFYGPPGTGKTTVVCEVIGALRGPGARQIDRGRVLLVVCSNNTERRANEITAERAGYTVLSIDDYRHLFSDASARIADMLAANPALLYYCICVTIHSLARLLYSKNALTRAESVHARLGILGPAIARPYDLGICDGRVDCVWLSEVTSCLHATGGPLVPHREITLEVLLRVVSSARVVTGDGPIDEGSMVFVSGLVPGARFICIVPDTPRHDVRLYSDLPAWLACLAAEVTALSATDGAVVLCDSASYVPLLASFVQSKQPGRVVVIFTAESPHDASTIDAMLRAGVIFIISPVIATCLDLQAKCNLYAAFFGHGPDAHTLLQMCNRLRWFKSVRRIFLRPPFGTLDCGPISYGASVDLLSRLLPVVNERERRGCLFPDVESAVPPTVEGVTLRNRVNVTVANLDLFYAGEISYALLAGMCATDVERARCVRQLVLEVEPGEPVALVCWCVCNAAIVDATYDRVKCIYCGELPVVLTATARNRPFMPAEPDSEALMKLEDGFFWRTPGLPCHAPGLPKLSTADMLAIANILRYGNQAEWRWFTAFLSMLRAGRAQLSYVDAPAGVAVSPEVKLLVSAMESPSADKTERALAILNVDLVGLSQSRLVRDMLGSCGPDRADNANALRVLLFLQSHALPFTGEVLDRLREQMLVPWHARYPKNHIRQNAMWCVQCAKQSGEGPHLQRWRAAVNLFVVGEEAPASGVGSMQAVLDMLGCVRFARLLALLCEITGHDQSARPLILSLDGIRVTVDTALLVLTLVKCKADAESVLLDVLSSLRALGLAREVPRDVASVTVMDLIRMVQQTVQFSFGMSMYFSKDGVLKCNYAYLLTRLQVLWMSLMRDLPADPPAALKFLVRCVRAELVTVTDPAHTPLFDIGGVVRPSAPMPRTATADTAPYDEDEDSGSEAGDVSEASVDDTAALRAYMGRPVDGFGSSVQCGLLWSRLSATEREWVHRRGGTPKEHLKLKLAIRTLVKAILTELPQSALGKAYEKLRNMQRTATVDDAGSQLSSVLSNLSDLSDIGFARTRDVPEPDTESESDAEDDRPTKYSKFIDGEAGQSTQRQMQEELRLADSGAETDGYD
jgi:hypothetical protein